MNADDRAMARKDAAWGRAPLDRDDDGSSVRYSKRCSCGRLAPLTQDDDSHDDCEGVQR